VATLWPPASSPIDESHLLLGFEARQSELGTTLSLPPLVGTKQPAKIIVRAEEKEPQLGGSALALVCGSTKVTKTLSRAQRRAKKGQPFSPTRLPPRGAPLQTVFDLVALLGLVALENMHTHVQRAQLRPHQRARRGVQIIYHWSWWAGWIFLNWRKMMCSLPTANLWLVKVGESEFQYNMETAGQFWLAY